MSDIPEMIVTAEPCIKVGREISAGYLFANPHFTVNPGVTFTGADFEMDVQLPNGVTVRMEGHFATEQKAVEAFTEAATQMGALTWTWRAS